MKPIHLAIILLAFLVMALIKIHTDNRDYVCFDQESVITERIHYDEPTDEENVVVGKIKYTIECDEGTNTVEINDTLPVGSRIVKQWTIK